MTKYFNTSRILGKIHILRRIATVGRTLKIPLYKGQYELLNYVIENPGCSQAQIACELMISPACVALSVKRLTKAQLLVKESDAENLRCNKLYCTEKARDAIIKCREIMDEFDTNAFSGFSDEELKQFENFAQRITDNIVNSYFDGKQPHRREAIAIIKKIEEEEK